MSTPRALRRPRRDGLGLVLAALVVGSTLAGCGSNDGPGATTCAQVGAMSAAQRVDLLGRLARDVDGQDFLGADATEKDARARALVALCKGQPGSTRLDDVSDVSADG